MPLRSRRLIVASIVLLCLTAVGLGASRRTIKSVAVMTGSTATAAANLSWDDDTKKLGIGTQTPQGQVHISGGATEDLFAGMGPDLIAGPSFNFGYGGGSFGRSVGFFNIRPDGSASAPNPSLRFMTGNTERMLVANNGNVSIGLASGAVPSERLHVGGNIYASQNITAGGYIHAKYQDVAEWVTAREPLSGGTVVVISESGSNVVERSHDRYDTSVAGVVSAQPGIALGEEGPDRVLVAQSGRVRVKVDASYGAIRAGDLLVTSPSAGFAMRSAPVDVGGISVHRPGTVLGKALEPLKRGQGEILVLLTLQ